MMEAETVRSEEYLYLIYGWSRWTQHCGKVRLFACDEKERAQAKEYI